MNVESDSIQLVKNLLKDLKIPLNDEALENTPRRYVKALKELLDGYQQDPKQILCKRFKEKYNEIIALKSIPYYSLCEHHLLPFYGTVDIVYLPNGEVVGLSKFTRLVECYSKRLQLQERLTNQIAEALMKYLKPQGLLVRVKGYHMCMIMRGVKSNNQNSVITCVVKGKMLKNNGLKSEALAFLA